MNCARIDAFFAFDPCASRIFHRPSFLASMLLSPRDARFPHTALLHAIVSSFVKGEIKVTHLIVLSVHPHLDG